MAEHGDSAVDGLQGSLATSPRALRARFLDPYRSAASRATLDAVARMLLEVDRTAELMQAGLGYLAETLGVSRADIGTFEGRRYAAVAEHRDAGVPSLLGQTLPASSAALQEVWRTPEPISYENIDSNPALAGVRSQLAAAGTRSMLAQRLDHQGRAFAIACFDDVGDGTALRRWTAGERAFAGEFCRDFLGPILGLSRQLADTRTVQRPSPAELDAVRLAARGLRYKQIAAELGKSIRTVEFQLRSARAKVGAANQVELVKACEAWL